MTLRPTRDGGVFLGLMAVLYLAALTSQSSLLLLLVGIVVGCLLINLSSVWRGLKGLELQPPRGALLSEGQRLTLPWKVINRGDQTAACIQVDSQQNRLFRLQGLEPAQTATVAADLRFPRRGVFAYSAVRLSSVYPYGLVQASRALDLPGEVVVAPAIYPVAPPQAAGFDVMVGGKHKGKHRSTSGADFSGVRPMQPGDPFKQIHWRSSAKGQGLMVKTFEEELSGRVSFILDCGHSGDGATLDDCLRAAGSLMFAALELGHHVEWIDLTHLQVRLVPLLSDGDSILHALARIEMDSRCLNRERLAHALASVSSRSAIHLLFTGYADAVRAALAGANLEHRKISLYLPQGCAAPAIEGLPVFHYTSQEIR